MAPDLKHLVQAPLTEATVQPFSRSLWSSEPNMTRESTLFQQSIEAFSGDSKSSSSSKPAKDAAVRVLHSFNEAEPFRDAWNAVVAQSGADIYQTFEWCEIWWKYYGTKRQLHVQLFFEQDRLIGVFPGFVENLRIGPAALRIAKPVGTDYTLNLSNLAILPEFIEAAVGRVLRYFVEECACDLVLIGPLSGPNARIDQLVALGRQMPEIVGDVRARGDSCNTYFALPDSFETYLKQLDKKQRSNFKRMMDQSSKAHRITFDVISDEERATPAFEEFCRQHETQWRTDGKLGHFGDWPHAVEFNRELIHALAGRGCVRFYRILADDAVISAQYCFVFGKTVYWRLPSRVRSAEWDRLSLGTMGLVKMVDALISEGVTVIEGGRGHYAYKVHHGASEFPLRTLQFVRRGTASAVKVRLFTLCARILDFVYYRIVFMRIAPRVRSLQRPLWPFWIRANW
ncbi:MAG: hypothetical protein JWM88_1885 [Verrucomicrobia bacterium]|nr:hypothetical protein [Verrucomicrobiota bacterium]